jgi:hypothetical protein
VTSIRAIASTILFASLGVAQAPPSATLGAMEVQNAPLANVIDALARQLRINYVLDTQVVDRASVTTYGDSRGADAREVLDTILQSSHARMIEITNDRAFRPIELQIVPPAAKSAVQDRIAVHLVFLKDMPADRVAEIVLRVTGQEPVEVVRKASSNLLVIRIRVN